MEALTELCDLVAKNPTLFADKLAWICSRCPSSAASQRLTRANLNSLLALARFLSKSPAPSAASRSPLLDFLRNVPLLRPSLWPQSFSQDHASSFLNDLFKYLAAACSISPDLVTELQSFFGHTLLLAARQYIADDSAASKAIAKAFLSAVVNNCPPILPADAETVVECLLDGVAVAGTSSTENSVSSSSWDSKGKGKDESGEVMDDGSSEAVRDNGSGTPRRSVSDQVLTPTLSSQSYVGRFEEEAVEVLERMEIVFRLVVDVLDPGGKNVVLRNLEEVRLTATAQIKSLSAFLKVPEFALCLNLLIDGVSGGHHKFTREFSVFL